MDSQLLTILVQILILIITVFSTHIIVSKQIRKNKKAEWIDKLRNEVSNFTSEIITISMAVPTDELKAITRIANNIILLLDPNDPDQRILENEIGKIMKRLSSNPQEDHIMEVTLSYQLIIKTTRMIMKKQASKI